MPFSGPLGLWSKLEVLEAVTWAGRGRDTHGKPVLIPSRQLTFSHRPITTTTTFPPCSDAISDVWVINGVKHSAARIVTALPPALLRPGRSESDIIRSGAIGPGRRCSFQVGCRSQRGASQFNSGEDEIEKLNGHLGGSQTPESRVASGTTQGKDLVPFDYHHHYYYKYYYYYDSSYYNYY